MYCYHNHKLGSLEEMSDLILIIFTRQQLTNSSPAYSDRKVHFIAASPSAPVLGLIGKISLAIVCMLFFLCHIGLVTPTCTMLATSYNLRSGGGMMLTFSLSEFRYARCTTAHFSAAVFRRFWRTVAEVSNYAVMVA